MTAELIGKLKAGAGLMHKYCNCLPDFYLHFENIKVLNKDFGTVCSMLAESTEHPAKAVDASDLSSGQVMEEEVTSDEEEAVPTPKGRTKKMKGIPYQDLVAMQEQRRIERRQKHRDRPKTHYKGLTWHVNQSGKGTWHVQVWTGKTVRL